jgi:hypothetical protein
VLVAEWLDPGKPADRQAALRLAARTVSLALEHLSGGNASDGAARCLERPPIELFRIGQTLIRELSRRARALKRDGWLGRVPNGLGLLEPELRRVLEACRLPRPRRFVGVDEDGRPRTEPFAVLSELTAARRTLDTIGALGRLLVDGLGLPPDFDAALDLSGCLPAAWPEISAGDLLRTALVHGVVSGRLQFTPVTGADLAAFVRRAVDGGRLVASVRAEAVEALLARLPRDAAAGDARSLLEGYLDVVLDRLGDEVAGLAPSPLPDVRFVGGLVRRPD